MNRYEVIGKISGVNLCRKNDFYFIRRNDGFMWDMCGEKEQVKQELQRWLIEVDSDNDYMKEIEEYFINILENQ